MIVEGIEELGVQRRTDSHSVRHPFRWLQRPAPCDYDILLSLTIRYIPNPNVPPDLLPVLPVPQILHDHRLFIRVHISDGHVSLSGQLLKERFRLQVASKQIPGYSPVVDLRREPARDKLSDKTSEQVLIEKESADRKETSSHWSAFEASLLHKSSFLLHMSHLGSQQMPPACLLPMCTVKGNKASSYTVVPQENSSWVVVGH